MPRSIQVLQLLLKRVPKRDRKETYIETFYPGYHIFQNTFYVGTVKGLGKIYQQDGIDTYSTFGFAKVYPDKKADSAWIKHRRPKSNGMVD